MGPFGWKDHLGPDFVPTKSFLLFTTHKLVYLLTQTEIKDWNGAQPPSVWPWQLALTGTCKTSGAKQLASAVIIGIVSVVIVLIILVQPNLMTCMRSKWIMKATTLHRDNDQHNNLWLIINVMACLHYIACWFLPITLSKSQVVLIVWLLTHIPIYLQSARCFSHIFVQTNFMDFCQL